MVFLTIMCPPPLRFFIIKKSYLILILNLKINLKTHINRSTRVQERVNSYITFICVSIHIVFHIVFYKFTSVHVQMITKTKGTYSSSGNLQSPSCWVGFSSCVASQTCRLLLAHSRHRNMYPQPDNMRQWKNYKCQILFGSCLPCPALTCATVLWISWAVASFCGNFHKSWGMHKHSIHTRLSLHVASRTAFM